MPDAQQVGSCIEGVSGGTEKSAFVYNIILYTNDFNAGLLQENRYFDSEMPVPQIESS